VVKPRLKNRPSNDEAAASLERAGVHPLLSRLWAMRGVNDPDQIATKWQHMIAPQQLSQSEKAAALLADAIEANKRLLIIADYDCDGATACAVGVRALRQMGAKVDFLVPNRFETGYGLSPEIVELALQHPAGRPDYLITVDNGIASIDGVEKANACGLGVIVTDHHLPGDTLPDADAIVNPNQPDCGFPSKNLAGVGVIFYLMVALRAELRQRGVYANDGGPALHHLADLVALGTVADVVRLDSNNRLLVAQGLKRIRAGQMQVGVRALFAVAGRHPQQATTFDLGFALGPRINAAGRLADMSIGIHCLLSDDEGEALSLARQLDEMNQKRRTIERSMKDQAQEHAAKVASSGKASLCVYHPDWHQGVVGLVASRLKEQYWRPVLAFAPADDDELRGSGRSIPDVHLRDALDLVSKRDPDLILKFGGHAMAAGLSLRESKLSRFSELLDEAIQELTGRQEFEPIIETDGSLDSGYANVEVAGLLANEVWGAGFPAPVFRDRFRVLEQRVLKGKHLKLSLERQYQRFDAIWFNRADPLSEAIEAAYRIEQNIWNGRISLQLIIEYAEKSTTF